MDPKRCRLLLFAYGAAAAFVVLFLQGCLYTSHHLNTARLVEPGKTRWEFGAGTQRVAETACSDDAALQSYLGLKNKAQTIPHLSRDWIDDNVFSYSIKDHQGRPACEVQYYAGNDTVTHRAVSLVDTFATDSRFSIWPNFSIAWRLGVREVWGPFTGVDIGWRVEAPTGPATLEFDTRFGLPLPASMARWNHAVSLGWGIGAWADNSLFAEYAFGQETGRLRPFGNTRLTYLASQPMDITVNHGFTTFTRYRRWIGQANIGLEWVLPDLPLLPQRILPSLALAMPALPFYLDDGHFHAEGVDLRFVLGASWSL